MSDEQAQTSAEEAAAEPVEEESPGKPEEERPLAILEADPDERERVAEFEAELEHPVWAISPGEIDLALLDALADAVAIVVGWDLEGRPGLDLVETLARREATAAIPLAMSAAQATRGMVVAALRAGARTFLLRPYAADEVRQRLLAPSGSESNEP